MSNSSIPPPPSPQPAVRNLSLYATVALVGVCIIWGTTFTVVKDALDDASALVFLTLRFGLATASLWMVFRWRGPLRPGRELLRTGGLIGIALFAGYLFQTIGLRFTTPARSAFLTGLFIVFVPAIIAFQRKRLPSGSEILGIAAGFVGLAFLASPVSFNDTSIGDALTVVCALAYAVHILLLARFAGTVDLRALTLIQIGTAFILSLSTFWWVEVPVLRLTPRLWLAVGITGILATAVAFLVQTWAQRHVPPTRTAFIFALEPVFAWITSFLVAGERLSVDGATGAALILFGILLVEIKPLTWLNRRRLGTT